ncbi:MAG: glycosyltransferase [Acidobacteria bacterium]|nr:glycosyltransferase [Acidobacteriota bacterium]
MRTLHITSAWHAHSGGARTFYTALLDAAEAHGREMALVVPGDGDGLQQAGVSTRIYTVAAPPSPLFDRRYRVVLPHRIAPTSRTWLWRIIRAEAPDVIEVADKLTLCHVAGLVKRHAGPRPTVIGFSHERFDDAVQAHLGGGVPARALARSYVRAVYLRQFDAHIANSEYTADELRVAAASGGPAAWRHWRMRDRIVAVPLGADVETFGPGRRSDGARQSLLTRLGGDATSKVVLFAGRLSAEKAVDLLLPAVRLAVDRGCDVRLVVAGDGPMREQLARDAREFLPGRCLFLGHVGGREELAALVASVDAFVHTNPREPFGIGPLEALVSGVPVVLPRSGGVLSYATDETAWLVRPDAVGLADGLVECLTRADEAKRRSAHAVAMAPAWSWAGAATRYFDTVAALDLRRRTEWAPEVDGPGRVPVPLVRRG